MSRGSDDPAAASDLSLTTQLNAIRCCLVCRDGRRTSHGDFATRIWRVWRRQQIASVLCTMRGGYSSFVLVRTRQRAMRPKMSGRVTHAATSSRPPRSSQPNYPSVEHDAFAKSLPLHTCLRITDFLRPSRAQRATGASERNEGNRCYY